MNKRNDAERDLLVAYVCFLLCIVLIGIAILMAHYDIPVTNMDVKYQTKSTMKDCRVLYWKRYHDARDLGLGRDEAHKAAIFDIFKE